MKKALIDKRSNRLCQVAPLSFPVAADLEWRDCADDVAPETHDFDGTSFLPKPSLPAPDPAVVTRLAVDAQELAAAKVDSAINALINSTPAQLVTFARNNFPTLTLAEQNRLGMILDILAVAVRPHVR